MQIHCLRSLKAHLDFSQIHHELNTQRLQAFAVKKSNPSTSFHRESLKANQRVGFILVCALPPERVQVFCVPTSAPPSARRHSRAHTALLGACILATHPRRFLALCCPGGEGGGQVPLCAPGGKGARSTASRKRGRSMWVVDETPSP